MNRRHKLMTGFSIIAAALALILWNTSAQSAASALTVTEAKQRSAELSGQDVTVRGTVVDGTVLNVDGRVLEFLVSDSSERLRVVYNRTPPDNFGPKEVVLKGQLRTDDTVAYLEAQTIQVGCASKY